MIGTCRANLKKIENMQTGDGLQVSQDQVLTAPAHFLSHSAGFHRNFGME